MKRYQTLAACGVALFVLLGLAASTGFTPIPRGHFALAPWFHPLVLAFGAFCGYALIRRSREIDEVRWQTVEADDLTSGERQYAHREADRETRSAGTAFFLCAVGLGGWLSYQLKDPETIGLADLLILSSFAGFAVGMLVGARLHPRKAPRF